MLSSSSMVSPSELTLMFHDRTLTVLVVVQQELVPSVWELLEWDLGDAPGVRKPMSFPIGDDRFNRQKKYGRVYACDSCHSLKWYHRNGLEFDGEYIFSESFEKHRKIEEQWKEGLIDATWWCTECYQRHLGVNVSLEEIRMLFGIKYESRHERSVQWQQKDPQVALEKLRKDHLRGRFRAKPSELDQWEASGRRDARGSGA